MTGKMKQLPPLRQESFLRQNQTLFAAIVAASEQLRQTSYDREEVFQIFCDHFGQAGLAGGIALFEDKEEKNLVFQAATTTDKVVLALERQFKHSMSGMRFLVSSVDVYQQVVTTRHAVYLFDTSKTHLQMIPAKFKSFSGLILNKVQSFPGIYAPLISENRLIGVMSITHELLTESDVPLVTVFADRIAQMLDNARLHQAQRQMHTDIVTSQGAWQRLIQQTPIGIQIFDPSGYCREINPAAMVIYGVTREEIIGKLNVFRNELTQEMGIASAVRLALHGETVELENIAFTPMNQVKKKHQTGYIERRVVNTTIFPIYDDHGSIVNLVSLNIDVTARTRSDLLQNALYQIAALATSESSLQELYSYIHAIIADLMAADNFFISIHDEKTDLIHLPYFVDEEDDDSDPYSFGNGLIEHVIRTGEALLINEEQHHQLIKEGKVDLVGPMGPIWLGAPLRTKGKTFGVIAVQHYEDENAYTSYHKQILVFVSGQIAAAITRKRAEEEVRGLALRLEQQAETITSMLATTRTHFYIYDRHDRITYISPSALKTFEIEAVTVLGKSWNHLPFTISDEFAAWMRHIFVTNSFATQELRLTVEGNSRCYEVQVNPIRDRGGKVEKVVMNMSDITDKKMDWEVFLHTQKIESLGILAGGIAHDFNNLLVALMGQSSLALAKLPSDSGSRKHIEKVIAVTKQAAALTEQLLAYSGKGDFMMQLVNFNRLIDKNSHLIEIAIPKTVGLFLNLYETLPDIEADKGQMQQILMNLILNAAESIPNHGMIWIETGVMQIETDDERFCQQLDEPLAIGEYVYLQIRDDGEGMDDETMASIFDPFYSTKFTGRGLGLAAVLGIVRGHQGCISVSSRVGEGTAFHVLFPVGKTAVSPPQQPILQTAVSPIINKGSIVLLIDDDPHVRESIEDILEMEKIIVIAAADGQAGVDLYREREDEIGLILLDLSMPGLSGHETFIKLHEINTAVNIILSSGFSKEDVHQQFAGEQVADFLSKPYDINVLIDKVRYYLRS